MSKGSEGCCLGLQKRQRLGRFGKAAQGRLTVSQGEDDEGRIALSRSCGLQNKAARMTPDEHFQFP